jgi:hypothetical protein
MTARKTVKAGIDHTDLYTMVTPQMAEEFLDRNTHNRPLRAGAVEKIVRDIKAGKWERNGQTVTIDWNDAIHNGQHRLFAVVESGIAVPMILLTGLDPATVMTVDTGVARTYADYEKLRGGADGQPLKNVNNYQAALKLIDWYEKRWPGVRLASGRDGTATHHELHEIAGRYPHLSDAVNYVQARNGPTRNVTNPTTMAFVYAMGMVNYPAEADHWLQTIWSNEGEPNNPAISYRARLTAARLAGRNIDRATMLCFTIKSWNAFAQGERLLTYRWADDEPMPAIYGTPQYTGKLGAHKVRAEARKAGKTGIGKRRPRR